jgi:uncharacterized protein YkwD
MRVSGLSAFATALLVGCVVPMSGSPPASGGSRPSASSPSSFSATESRIFDLINAQRRRQGLQPLAHNPQLDRMAKIQAENMARFQKMAHNIPDASLPTLGDRARYVGYMFSRISENVALGYPNAETVVNGWMTSTGHRRNILDGGVVETGIGIARSAAGGVYYCQVFGQQLSSL